MDTQRFDTVSRFFATRRFSRRRALAEGGAGIAAGVLGASLPSVADGQDAIPSAQPSASRGPEMLFLQSFQAGNIAAKEGEAGRYTVTLQQGLGQTIYFSDRPDRIVGASPTPHFLKVLGFSDDNPPNAALIVETAPGESEIAVIELFNPIYDDASRTATYEAEVLANWEKSTDMGFSVAPTDLAALAPSFGAAHLFIDGIADCPDGDIQCISYSVAPNDPEDVKITVHGIIPNSEHDGFCMNWSALNCQPCQPKFDASSSAITYWTNQCSRFEGCGFDCVILGFCSESPNSPDCW